MLERDELGGWLSLMQTEDGASARAFYLECFDGTNSYTYDRIGRGTIIIESCCLSLIGCIQPSRIAPLVRSAISGEWMTASCSDYSSLYGQMMNGTGISSTVNQTR